MAKRKKAETETVCITQDQDMGSSSQPKQHKKTYQELLKDPRWQKKRTEIFTRDNFTCQLCRSKENTLHVHHNWYIWNNPPWNYDNDCFVTLCESCHNSMKSFNNDLMKCLYYTFGIRGLNSIYLSIKNNYQTIDFCSTDGVEDRTVDYIHILVVLFESPEFAYLVQNLFEYEIGVKNGVRDHFDYCEDDGE